MIRFAWTVLFCFTFFLIGCQQRDNTAELKEKIQLIEQEKQSITAQLRACHAAQNDLQKRIDILSGLESSGQVKKLYNLDKVEISRYTNFYDRDNDGRKEKFVCYIKPIDTAGDSIKVIGAVQIELWDLDLQAGQAKIAQWQIEGEELQKKWFSSFLGIHYRLVFDVGETDYAGRELTVKVSFTDHLTGKVYRDQKVINP